MTVTEGAAKIEEVADKWTESQSTESIYAVVLRAANKLSDDPIFNLAAYMKYSFGACLSGEGDGDWIHSAKEVSKLLSSSTFREHNAPYVGSPSWKE